MLIHPAFNTILKNNYPTVSVFDVRDSATGATTYTFSSANLIELGADYSSADAYGAAPHVKARSRKMIAVAVHAEDATTTYTVNSVTLGGVAGTELGDQGGSAVVTSAMYVWSTESLAGITDSDVVVTFSEAISACAVAILVIDNVGIATGINNGTNQNSAAITLAEADKYMLAIQAATSSTGAGGALVAFAPFTTSNNNGAFAPQWLYEGSNSVMSWAGAYAVSPGYDADGQLFISRAWSAGTPIASIAAFY